MKYGAVISKYVGVRNQISIIVVLVSSYDPKSPKHSSDNFNYGYFY